MLWVFVLAVTVEGGADAEEKFETVTEIVSVIAIETVGAIVDGELCPETDIDAVSVRQVADVTKCIGGYWKDARVTSGI